MRILIVEDEQKIAQAIKKGLEQESFAVDAVYDGAQGLKYAEDDTYDVIILDVMMPKMDGIEMCKQLRQKNIHTPVLMLTAKGSLGDRVTGLNQGADDYLAKPFAFDELLARVRALLRRPPAVIGSILSVGDLSLDTVTHEVRRADKSISLSTKEYALLDYLMRNPNRILTKTQIIDHVWDFDADILPNTVEAYIRYLRVKIEQPFAKSEALIHTVRGFGYKIGTAQ